MVDADGATDYHEIEKIYKEVRDLAKRQTKNMACSIGSRNTATAAAARRGIRKLLNWGMMTLVKFVLGKSYSDT